jgi:hypothetical protein
VEACNAALQLPQFCLLLPTQPLYELHEFPAMLQAATRMTLDSFREVGGAFTFEWSF